MNSNDNNNNNSNVNNIFCNATLSIGNKSGTPDYVVSLGELCSIDSIQSNINTVSIPYNDREEMDYTTTSALYKLITNSNVTTLRHVQSLSMKLPDNLTCISFDIHFNEPLTAGFLPASLKILKLGPSFNQVFGIGQLPNTLEELELNYRYNQPIQPGALPPSLKILKLNHLFKHELEVGSLPPKLEVLHYSGHDIVIKETGVLPNTLYTLTNAPVSWIAAIRLLPNIKGLKFYQNESVPIFDLDQLPPNLTRLSINTVNTTLKSRMPSTITHLNICYTNYDIDEIFPERSQYHFTKLILSGTKQDDISHLKIRELKLRFTGDDDDDVSLKLIKIPFGVKLLTLDSSLRIDDPSSIPSSVTTITVAKPSSIKRLDLLPSTVKELITSEQGINLLKEIIPSSIEKLIVSGSLTNIPNTYKSGCNDDQ
ncbi:hypothetical protein PPL_07725 [Heterostelium album PN500]|uniref:FNIP repeat-containing protein n=1 Tax=Heterostelium pallidum (strain ATCC 26659 / Pp 5 / PN500) TaxID=670386 RepID=D3BGS3_HETP5|nr:hypothetical protein PPL_07725 [Heterostelium album PN500]EFA79307.1 hypothetical protein PPL_07725 [Heterostelium album PN500]|eukprot:XP_020431428.1 hypothetical protein PPL_07725 [Heterostelium album PN500]